MNEFTELYDSIHMSPELKAKIRNPVPVRKARLRPAVAVAAVFMVVCLIGCSPTVRAAVGDMLVIVFPGLDLTIYEKPLQSGSGDGVGQIIAIDTNQTTFAEIRDGRLYFTGNDENLDITDQITEDSPYFYTYEQDQYEITLIVGYTDSIENFGTYEFIKEDGAWFTGSGRNFLSNVEEGKAYPWVKVVWDTLDVPWPMPGAESNG